MNKKLDTIKYSASHTLYLRHVKKQDRFVRIMRYVLLLAIIILWEGAAMLGLIDTFITSSPSRIVVTLVRLFKYDNLLLHIGVTLFETILGFVLGTLLGTLLAIVLWWNKTLCSILDPYLVVLNALPKIALGPILIVWIGAGMESIIAMALLISLVVTIMTVLSGFLEENAQRQMLMKTLGATKMQIFYMVVLPASIPTIVSSLKISVGMSWVGVIVGEYLVSKAGLGYLIVYGGQVFKLDLVMTSVVVLCILAALMYYVVAWLEKVLVAWRSHSR